MNIETAVEKLGSQAALAAAVGVTPQMVNQWVHGVRPVSPRAAKAIEAATAGAVKRHELRPDLWEAPAEGAEPGQAA